MFSQQEIEKNIRTIDAPKWKFWVGDSDKAQAVAVLSQIGIEAIPSLINSLSGPGSGFAVLALEKIGPDVIPACLKAMRGPGAGSATLVIIRLGAACVDELINEFSGEAAAYASLALKEIGQPALPALIQGLQQKESTATVRMWTVMTLGEMGSWASEALPILEEMKLADPSSDVREAAGEAIDKIKR